MHQNILIVEKIIIKMGIYEDMKKDWKAYCLMSGVVYIEEISKPLKHIQIKYYKDRKYECECFRSVRLKMNNKEITNKIFEITKSWEQKIRKPLIGASFEKVRKENFSKQDMFLFTPIWLNLIIAECGQIPNKYSYCAAIERIKALKQYEIKEINQKKNLFKELLKNKKLAAGAFIVSMDLEMRGVQTGAPSLCMSEKFKDFLEFMLKVAQKWKWTKNKCLSNVDVSYNKKLGIDASPQYEFRLNIFGLKEIYCLAGPLADSLKDKCISFHTNRSTNYKNKGYYLIKNNTKQKIFEAVKNNINMTTTQLQFIAGVRVDVILDHLHKLEKENKVIGERRGKRYLWNVK